MLWSEQLRVAMGWPDVRMTFDIMMLEKMDGLESLQLYINPFSQIYSIYRWTGKSHSLVKRCNDLVEAVEVYNYEPV